jgi:hypothetical protein
MARIVAKEAYLRADEGQEHGVQTLQPEVVHDEQEHDAQRQEAEHA